MNTRATNLGATLVKLARAIAGPGGGVTVHDHTDLVTVTIVTSSDDGLRQLAEDLELPAPMQRHDDKQTWLSTAGHSDGLHISAYGPMQPRSAGPMNDGAATRAANEALEAAKGLGR